MISHIGVAFLVGLAFGQVCFAQVTLSLSSGSSTTGSLVALPVNLSAIATDPPASLQWTINYSTQDFAAASVSAGSTGVYPNKTLECTNSPGVATCLLWGTNASPISNGVVATLSLTPVAAPVDASAQVQLVASVAADGTGKSLSSSSTNGVVTLQPSLNGFTCTPNSLAPPASATCNVAITPAAPSGGATIALSASPAVIGMPSSVTIAASSMSATFSATANAVSAATPVTLSATYGGATETFGLTIQPAVVLSNLAVSPSNLTPGQSGLGTVTLSAPAPAGGALVSLSSSNSGVVSVAASVTVSQGSTSATFAVMASSGTTNPSSVTLMASYSGVSKTVAVTVTPPALTGLAISPNTIVSGRSATGTVTLNEAAPSGGLVVALSTSNASASLPSTVSVPAGASSATFAILAKPVNTSTPVTVTASLAAVSETATLTISPLPATASWLKFDTSTQGNWKSKYGSSGDTIAGDSTGGLIKPVSQASVTTWKSSTSDVRALQKGSGSGRLAAAWDSSAAFLIDINPPDTLVHQIAVYCLDWTSAGRVESISVLDGNTSQVLDTRSVTNFSNGTYVLWSVSGHVKLQIKRTATRNAVVSGVFVD